MIRAGFRSARGMGGFTLLELLIAVALMAFVALLGWRGLDAVITARDDITRHSDRLRALAQAFGQIEDDLRSAWFTRLMVTRDPVLVLRKDDLTGFALELLRISPSAAAQAAGLPEPFSRAPDAESARGGQAQGAPVLLHQVIWRVRDGVLERGAVPWRPGSGEVGGVARVWQPVVPDIQAVQWRVWIESSGWLPESPPPARQSGIEPQEGEPIAAPTVAGGVELTLSVAGERIVRILAARD
jgi:prepilin-type N-terminal cleavage/methylation domain-containing protein